MKPIANQKIITINKEVVTKDSGKGHPYFVAYVDTIEKAASELKGNAFKVYIYLLSNLNGFHFGLSPQDISNRYGMSIDSARDGINALIDKEYLVLLDGTKTEYTFYDRVDRKPVELPEEFVDVFIQKEFSPPGAYEPVIRTYGEILIQCGGNEERAKRVWETGRTIK